MSKNDTTSSYGLYLQTARVEKGVSIERVATETRIREDMLRAIEAEDHERLPDDVFVKGFLKSFAHAVDADADEALRRFALRRAAERPAARASHTPARRETSWWTLSWVALVMAGLIGGTLLVYQLVSRPGTEGASETVAPATTEAAAPENRPLSDTPAAAPSAPPATVEEDEDADTGVETTGEARPETANPPAADGMTNLPETTAGEKPTGYVLEIMCEEDTWLKVLADDAPASEHLLKPGDTLRLKAEERFNLLIGNAGGISVQLNGKPVPVPGRSGEVVNLELP